MNENNWYQVLARRPKDAILIKSSITTKEPTLEDGADRVHQDDGHQVERQEQVLPVVAVQTGKDDDDGVHQQLTKL